MHKFARLLPAPPMRFFVLAALAIGAGGRATAQQPAVLFDSVVETLERRYYDAEFRRERLPALVRTYRPLALLAKGRNAEKAVVDRMLAEIPVSHLALISESAYEHLMAELMGRDVETFGFELVRLPQGWFATKIKEGGPAACAGLLRGDRIIALDGGDPGAHPRLDWSTDDAALPDPPIHDLLTDPGADLVVEFERQPGVRMAVRIEVAEYSSMRAARASARVIEHGGKRFGYLHFWYLHEGGIDALLRDKLRGDFRGCDGLILDLRGRGGFAHLVMALIRVLEKDLAGMPMVALIDRGTRSGKEVVAWEIHDRKLGLLVGETTAGAVIPATFDPVDDDAVLMYPTMTLGNHTKRLEGVGVAPDVEVKDALAFAAGHDPILAGALRVLGEDR
ncbi:MAG TPA: S41 family peptidase [Planctomycetota bacterium]